MKEIIFATHNRNKLIEIQAIVPHFKLKSLHELGLTEEIPENEKTLEGNALSKARYVKTHFSVDCFADDTGLEVDALNGEPGVYSARYAGREKDAEANMQKLLRNLNGQTNRSARFRTIIALIINNEEYLFEGAVEGAITHKKQGDDGFGYDPIFMPDGYDRTFAQMPLTEKNTISHRKRAVQKLVDFLAER